MATIELTRKELYEILWSTPLSRLAERYALTREGFKTICRQFEIPMPDNGHWMKLKYNKKVHVEKFNPVFGGVDKIILTVRGEGSLISMDQTPLTIRTKEIEEDPKSPLTVPDKITKPDILTIQTKQYWKGEIKFTSYREDNRVIYPIRVEHANRKRALKFMDTFTKLIRYRGHTISKQYGDTGVLIDGIFIEIDLREASKRVPAKHPFSGTELEPIGEFIFKMGKYYPTREWRDGKVKIEEHLAKIVAKIEIEAKIEKVQKEASEIARLKREEETKRLAEIKKRKDEEIEKFNRLVALSEQYNKTILIRQFIKAEEEKAILTHSLTEEKKVWINWATDKADWLDPLINKHDDTLDN